MSPEEVEQILHVLAVERVRRSHDGQFVHFNCLLAPFKVEHKFGIDRKPSAWVTVDRGISRFGCHTCTQQAVDFIDALSLLNAKSGSDASRRAYNMSVDFEKNNRRIAFSEVYTPVDLTNDYKRFELTVLPTDFLKSKGIEKLETCKAFRLGVDVAKGVLLFPIIMRNQCVVGAQARQFVNVSSTGSKYFSYYDDVAKSHHLFGEHLLTLQAEKTASGKISWTFTGKAIIVFEGPLDVMHAYDIGLRNVVAIMGSKISPTQAKLLAKLAGKKPIFVVLDADEAGMRGAMKSVKEVFLDEFLDESEATDPIVHLCKTKIDPKKMTFKQFHELVTTENKQWRRKPIQEVLQEMLRAGKRQNPL